MMKVEVRLGKRAKGNFERVRKRLGVKVEKACTAVADFVLDRAKEYAPIDTQALYDSGRVRQEGRWLEAVWYIGFGSIDFDASPYGADRIRRPPYYYAPHVHTVTPFLSVVLQASWHDMQNVFTQTIKGLGPRT